MTRRPSSGGACVVRGGAARLLVCVFVCGTECVCACEEENYRRASALTRLYFTQMDQPSDARCMPRSRRGPRVPLCTRRRPPSPPSLHRPQVLDGDGRGAARRGLARHSHLLLGEFLPQAGTPLRRHAAHRGPHRCARLHYESQRADQEVRARVAARGQPSSNCSARGGGRQTRSLFFHRSCAAAPPPPPASSSPSTSSRRQWSRPPRRA